MQVSRCSVKNWGNGNVSPHIFLTPLVHFIQEVWCKQWRLRCACSRSWWINFMKLVGWWTYAALFFWKSTCSYTRMMFTIHHRWGHYCHTWCLHWTLCARGYTTSGGCGNIAINVNSLGVLRYYFRWGHYTGCWYYSRRGQLSLGG